MPLPVRTQFVDAAMVNASTNNVTITAPVNGHGVIIAVGIDGAGVTVSSVTLSGTTPTLLRGHVGIAPGDTAEDVEFWQALNVSGAGTTVTVNLSGTARFSMGVFEYSNLITAAILDKPADNDQASTFGNGTVGPTATTTKNNEVWLGIMHMHGTGGNIGDTWPSWNASVAGGFALVDQKGITAGSSVTNWRNTGYFEKIVSLSAAATITWSQTTAVRGVTITSSVVTLIGTPTITTLTQPSKARIQATATNTQAALARIQATVARTQAALARILAVVNTTQSAVSRIQQIVATTKTAKARITASVGKLQSAVGNIRNTTSRIQTAIGRLTNVVNPLQTAIARIRVTVVTSQAARARLQKAAVQAIASLARVRLTTTQVQSAKARIKVVVNATQIAIGRVLNTASKLQVATARITQVASQTIGANARIQALVNVLQTSTARITDRVQKAMNAVANIVKAGRGSYNKIVTSRITSLDTSQSPDTTTTIRAKEKP